MYNFCKSTITDEEFELLKESGFFDIPQFFRYTWKKAHRFDKHLIEIAEKAITYKGEILRQPLTGYKKVLYKSSSGYRECVAKINNSRKSCNRETAQFQKVQNEHSVRRFNQNHPRR